MNPGCSAELQLIYMSSSPRKPKPFATSVALSPVCVPASLTSRTSCVLECRRTISELHESGSFFQCWVEWRPGRGPSAVRERLLLGSTGTGSRTDQQASAAGPALRGRGDGPLGPVSASFARAVLTSPAAVGAAGSDRIANSYMTSRSALSQNSNERKSALFAVTGLGGVEGLLPFLCNRRSASSRHNESKNYIHRADHKRAKPDRSGHLIWLCSSLRRIGLPAARRSGSAKFRNNSGKIRRYSYTEIYSAGRMPYFIRS